MLNDFSGLAYKNLVKQSFREILVQGMIEGDQNKFFETIKASLSKMGVDESALKTITFQTLKQRLEGAFAEFWTVITGYGELNRVQMLANAFETNPHAFTRALKMRFQKFFADQIMSFMLDYIRLEGMEIKEVIESVPKDFLLKGVFILLLSGLSSSREWSSATNNFRFDTMQKLKTRSIYLNFCHNMNSVSTEAALACILTGKSFQNMKDQEVIDNLCQQTGTNLISSMQAQNFRISTFIGKEGFDWISKIGNNSNRTDLTVSRKDELILAAISGQRDQRTVARATANSVDDLLKMDQNILEAMTQDFSLALNKNLPTFSIGILFGFDRIAHELGESSYIQALQNVNTLLGLPSMERIFSDEHVLSVICSDHGMSFGLGIGDHRRTYDDLEVKYSPLLFHNRNFTSKALWMANDSTAYSLVDIAPTILRLGTQV